jgi:hypothetical protein
MTSAVNLYNPTTGLWTKAGDSYLMRILAANRYPSKKQKEEIIIYAGIPWQNLIVRTKKTKSSSLLLLF